MGIFDVPAKYLIEETAEKLKTEIEQPEFFKFVKSGVHAERAPQREDWFYIRLGSVLYRAHKWNIISVERMRTYYGGRKRRGVRTEHHNKASGKVIRTCIQELEKAGYLEKAKPKGRKLTGKGKKILNETSKIVAKNIESEKYAKKKKTYTIKKKTEEKNNEKEKTPKKSDKK